MGEIMDAASLSQWTRLSSLTQSSFPSIQSQNPPGAPKKKKPEDNDNKNNSEDRKRPRDSEGASAGSNPTTPGRLGDSLAMAASGEVYDFKQKWEFLDLQFSLKFRKKVFYETRSFSLT